MQGVQAMTAQTSRQAFVCYNRKSKQITLVFSEEGRELALEAMKKVFGENRGEDMYKLLMVQLAGA
jgi:hypothetical protein